MIENDQAVQARLDLLHSLYAAGELSPEAYRARLAQLGLDAGAIAEQLAAGHDATHVGGDQVGGDKITVGEVGSGAAVAAGQHAVAIAGDATIINQLPPQVLALFARQFGFDPVAPDADALQTYFNNVILERHSKLSFLFIRPESGQVYTEADVETVFVPLRMTDPDAQAHQVRMASHVRMASCLERFDRLSPEMEDAARPVTLPDILAKYPCFLLRGKPGCGKTTLLRHIALAFARGQQAEKLGWMAPPPLPLLVSLRNFAAFLKSQPARYSEPQPRALLEYLEDHLRGAGVRFSAKFLPARLDNGECFLLLDALDEASGVLDGGGDLRAVVARQAASFIRHYLPRGNRFALSSRPRAYADDSTMRQAMPQPKVCDVLDLDGEGYRCLITNLLAVLTGRPADAQAEADDLLQCIVSNPHLSDLAGNPLLCTTLVLVYKYRGRKLPERRVDVLHEITTLLLGRWEEERRDVASPDELARLGTLAATTEQAIQFRRRALTAVAWRMQQDNSAELSADAAAQTLAKFYCDEERVDAPAAARWSRAFLDTMHERSGLFIAVDQGLYTFAHQAFREYLVATHLVNAGEARLIAEVSGHAPSPDEWWDQALLLAGAHPEQGSGAAGRLIEELLGTHDLEHAYLAARFAQDMTDKLPGPQRKKLQDWLIAAVQDQACPPQQRVRAGDALALAGDPRLGVGLSPRPLEEGLVLRLPDIAWCDVPAGPFLMGTREQDIPALVKKLGGKQDQYKVETPQHPVSLPAFCIARYPVTNAQYAAFTQDGGYCQPRYWPEARAAEVWQEAGLVKGWNDDKPRAAPYNFRPPYHLPNHPVVGITWYEAVAFCRWLTEQLRLAGEIGPEQEITLPSEAQWDRVKISPKHREGGQNSGNLLMLSGECAKGRNKRPRASLTWPKSNQQASRELHVQTW